MFREGDDGAKRRLVVLAGDDRHVVDAEVSIGGQLLGEEVGGPTSAFHSTPQSDGTEAATDMRMRTPKQATTLVVPSASERSELGRADT